MGRPGGIGGWRIRALGPRRGRSFSASLTEAPDLTSFDTLTGATESVAFTITFATLLAAANYTGDDPTTFRVEAISSGSMTKGGVPVTVGVTTIATGESFVWTSAAPAGGVTAAFTAKGINSGGESTTRTVNAEVTPAVIGTMEIVASSKAAAGLFTDEAGTIPTTAVGDQIKAWTNSGTAGGLLVMTGFSLGPLRASDGGINVLDLRPSGASLRVLGKDVASGGTENLTLYVVFKMLTNAAPTKPFLWSMKGTTDAEAAFPAYIFDQTYNHTGGVGGENWGLSLNPLPVMDDQWHVGVYRRTVTGGANGTWDIFYKGVKWDSAAVTASTTVARCNLGGGQGTGFSGYAAFIAMARTSAHSDAVIAKMLAYLENEFSAVLPVYDKVVVVVGDSKSSTQTCNVSNADATFAPAHYNWGQAARSLKSGSSLDAMYVHAWPGAQTSAHRTAASLARINGALALGNAKKVLAIYSGVNDKFTGGLTAQASYDQITGLIADVRAVVPTVTVLVEVPGDGDPAIWGGAGFNTFRADLKTLILNAANQVTYGYTAGTIHTDPVGYAWGEVGRLSSYYPTSDGLHCVGPGMDREAAVFITDLTALL